MASISDASALQMFKEVYGDGHNIIPASMELAKRIPFSQKKRVGESYVEAVVLTSESGITFSASTSAFQLNAPRAGVVKQASVVPYISVLPSIVPFGVISRSEGAGVRAFYDATKFIVRNNLRSHEQFQEIIRLYGQSPDLLGYVSYYTGTYRQVAFTDGTAVLDGITFTNGVSAQLADGTYAILLAPGSFAAGIWTGFEGARIVEVDENSSVQAAGTLKGVNSEYGYIKVDFAPSAPTAIAGGLQTKSDRRLCFEGMEDAADYVGINKILSTQSGNLFGINTSQYSLWQGSQMDLDHSSSLSLIKVQEGVANMVNKSGLAGDLVCFLNPRSWASLSNVDSAFRVYDSSYRQAKDEAGWEEITYYSQNGKISFVPHRCVKEGEAYALYMDCWTRSGSADVSFTVPGMPHELIFPLENSAGYAFRSYSDQYLFCHAPAKNLMFTGINDELTTP